MLKNFEETINNEYESNGSESTEFNTLCKIKENINKKKEFLKKDIFTEINNFSATSKKEAYNNMISCLSKDDFNKIVYATFKHRNPSKDPRFGEASLSYINTVNDRLKYIEVWDIYHLYEHPTLWDDLLFLVAKYEYKPFI